MGLSFSIGAVQAPPTVVMAAPPQAAAVMVPDPNAPYPPVLGSDAGKSVCNSVSLCRSYHSAAFIFYVLMLAAVIVLAWLGNNGTITLENAAIAITVLIGVTIVLMFIHWYWFMKGVIPECSGMAVPASAGISLSVGSTAAVQAQVPSGPSGPSAVAAAPAPVVVTNTTTTSTEVLPAAASAEGSAAQASVEGSSSNSTNQGGGGGFRYGGGGYSGGYGYNRRVAEVINPNILGTNLGTNLGILPPRMLF